jgi:hypothetical protein
MTQTDPICKSPLAGESSPAEQLRVPQFDVAHLLAWTTLTAILLSYSQAMEVLEMASGSPADEMTKLSRRLADEYPAMGFWMAKIGRSISAILTASALVGFGVLVWARLRIKFRRLQPGHWFVLIATIQGMFSLTAWIFLNSVASDEERVEWSIGYLAATGFIVVVLYTYAALRLRDARPWKVLFWVKVVGAWIGIASTMAILCLSAQARLVFLSPDGPWRPVASDLKSWWELGVSILWPSLLLFLLLTAAVLDIRRRTPRDWVHWLGVGIVAVGNLPPIALHVYFVFFHQEWRIIY